MLSIRGIRDDQPLPGCDMVAIGQVIRADDALRRDAVALRDRPERLAPADDVDGRASRILSTDWSHDQKSEEQGEQNQG